MVCMQRHKILILLFVLLNWFVASLAFGVDKDSNTNQKKETIEKKEITDNESADFELEEDELIEDDGNSEDGTDDDPALRDTPPSRIEVVFRSWTAPIALYFINKWTWLKTYFFVKSQTKKKKKNCKHPYHFHTPCSHRE